LSYGANEQKKHQSSCDVDGTGVGVRDEHGSGQDRTGTGLKPILAGSRLDWTAIFFKKADLD